MGIAVVTGASAGLGVEFARQLQHDPEVDEIWLVARRKDRLEDLAGELTAAKGVAMPVDLKDHAAVEELAQRMAGAGADLRVLVNNAGFAVSGPFWDRPVEDAMGMVDLNVRALVRLTHAALGTMTSGARILQVASSAAFYPMPGFSVYAATKTFVLYFTMALAAELGKKKIKATVLCPGATATEFWDVATGGKHNAPPIVTMKAEKVVRVSLRHLRGWRWLSVPGILYKFSALLSRWSPFRVAATVVRIFNPY